VGGGRNDPDPDEMALNLNLFKVSRERLKCAQCEVKHPIQGRPK